MGYKTEPKSQTVQEHRLGVGKVLTIQENSEKFWKILKKNQNTEFELINFRKVISKGSTDSTR